MKNIIRISVFTLFVGLISVSVFPAFSIAADDIGKVVALRGGAVIDREQKKLDARLSDGILLADTVSTKESSRAKMLFIDDSVLSVGEKSTVVIKEFVQSKDERSRAIFNLIDGKLRTVVGHSEFTVQTPTLVAAARGTVIYFETGVRDEIKYTLAVCLEGHVDIRSIDPSITGEVQLTAGNMIIVEEKKNLPKAVPIPSSMLGSLDMPAQPPTPPEGIATVFRDAAMPLVSDQQPISGTTPVNIVVVLPH